MRSRLLAFTVLALTPITLGASHLTSAAPPLSAIAPAVQAAAHDLYIVVLADPALASYRGGIAGLAATSPAVTGDAQLDVGGPASVAYLDHLDRVQADAIAAIETGIGRQIAVRDRYRHALNGFSARFSADEAAQVSALPGIVRVERETIDPLLTDAGPVWSGAPGIWDGSALGRPQEGSFGEGVIIGVIDTGINIDHPSFAAVDGEGYEHVNPRGKGNYLGWCNPSHPRYDAKWVCNDKLIGLWSHSDSSNSPEDEHGHGSHTASTAGGNRIAEAALVGPTITITRTISGVAPHANIVAYDACSGDGCSSSATVAAIDQAVADRVHVLNYSIQVGVDSPWRNTRSLAFLAAREAGVFVAVASGNAGPGPSTSYANAPWLLTIGNSTHNRTMTHTLDLDGGDTPQPAILGKGFTAPLPDPRPILYAKGFKNVDGAEDDGLCARPFPPDTFDSAIVLCDRGVAGRVAKGENVLAGGASGYILANAAADGSSLVLDAHALPALHISYADGLLLKTWMASGIDHNGTIGPMVIDEAAVNGDVMNASSSRGPSGATECCRRPDIPVERPAILDVLKPDVTAPGTDILAAVHTAPDRAAPEFDLMSGTSMASPHAAGAAALLRAVHPTWSPAAIQSALMTTARSASIRKEDASSPAGPFDRGAGHIDVSRAAQAGLVLEESAARFRAADPAIGGDPKTLNLASFQDAACLINCTWERTLTSSADRAVTWTWSGAADPTGPAVAVDPPVFTLAPGATQTIRVTASSTGLPPGLWAFADLMLASSIPAIPDAHFPLAVVPVAAELPSVVLINAELAQGEQAVSGLRAIGITDMTRDVHGLVKGETHSKALVPDSAPNHQFDKPNSTLVVTLTVPADTSRLVSEIQSTSARDVDLYVYRDATDGGHAAPGVLTCVSGSDGWLEYCDVRNPAPGIWWVVAHNARGSGNPPDETTIVTAVVPAEDAGNLVVTGPASVPAGSPFDLNLAYDLPSLAVGDRWYGAVSLGTDPANRGNLGLFAVDLVGIVTGTVPSPTPTRATATPTGPTATPTTFNPTPPVDERGIFMPALLRSAAGWGRP
jgi:subtilisin family serine protease